MKSVKLNDKLKGVPIYALCGIDLYRDIAELNEIENPVYALLSSYETEIASQGGDRFGDHEHVERVISEYCKFFTETHRSGSIVLLGFSFSGVIALEVAKLLKKNGVSVSGVIMLDSFKDNSHVRSKIKFMQDILSLALREGPYKALKLVGSRYLQRFKIKARYRKSFEQVQASVAEFRETAGPLKLSPEKFDGDIFLATSSLGVGHDYGFGMVSIKEYGWGKNVAGKIYATAIPVRHEKIPKGPGLRLMSPLLKTYLSDIKAV